MPQLILTGRCCTCCCHVPYTPPVSHTPGWCHCAAAVTPVSLVTALPCFPCWHISCSGLLQRLLLSPCCKVTPSQAKPPPLHPCGHCQPHPLPQVSLSVHRNLSQTSWVLLKRESCKRSALLFNMYESHLRWPFNNCKPAFLKRGAGILEEEEEQAVGRQTGVCILLFICPSPFAQPALPHSQPGACKMHYLRFRGDILLFPYFWVTFEGRGLTSWISGEH